MSRPDPLARRGAEAIRLAFEAYRDRFQRVTRRARRRFERREWLAAQQDARERLELYREVVRELEADLQRALGERLADPETWREMKARYTKGITAYLDAELAETFFNSITRRIFHTVGVDPEVEFVDRGTVRGGTRYHIHRTYPRRTTLVAMVAEMLSDHTFRPPYRDLEQDAERVAAEIEIAWDQSRPETFIEEARLIESVFYRGSAAYLVGRVHGGGSAIPMVIVLVHAPRGIEVDAVLLSEDEVSVVFSYTRSYFSVRVACPSQVVELLTALMPKKPIADLYISLGFNKHGKTELYRELLRHLDRTTDQFDIAPGERGMVMVVFAMPSFDYVFKIIRDEFDYPKNTTREHVMSRYQLVFEHDRAGRLVDAQEFEHLTFARERFTPALLEELETTAAGTVTVGESEVAIAHLYIERRMVPLDMFVDSADESAADNALLDYGQSIRDLAATNIFPGDLLLKNFGVTRHGRVIFYDYDELCLVTDCRFRDLPDPEDDEDEMRADPWFYVAPNDVFPEELIRFLGLSESQRRLLLDYHGEILTADWWRDLQRRHKAGEVLDLFPYPPTKRLDYIAGTHAREA